MGDVETNRSRRDVVGCVGLVCWVAGAVVGVRGQGVDLTALAWLAGDWEMATPGGVVEEHWTSPSANLLVGMSRTVRDGRTTAFEFIRVERRAEGVFYVAQPGGRPPTDFRLSSASAAELVFEGDGRDRVRRIVYRKEGDGLVATVEGEQQGTAFRQEYRYARRAAATPGVR